MKIDLDLPEGKSGDWAIDTFTVSKQDEDRQIMRSIVTRDRRYVPAGTYYRLTRGSHTIMSNTPDEINDCLGFIYKAKGNILINGLGLGVVLEGILRNEDVKHVKVIEKSPDVIALVAKHYLNKYPGRLEIIEASAYDYKSPKGEKYDCVWHDIWDDICSDNLEGMKKLHRKYGRKTKWQGSWCRARCEYQNKQERRMYW